MLNDGNMFRLRFRIRNAHTVSIETPGSSSAGDEIKHILGSLGVQYMHQNDEVLKPSHIEGMVAQKAIKVYISLCMIRRYLI